MISHESIVPFGMGRKEVFACVNKSLLKRQALIDAQNALRLLVLAGLERIDQRAHSQAGVRLLQGTASGKRGAQARLRPGGQVRELEDKDRIQERLRRKAIKANP